MTPTITPTPTPTLTPTVTLTPTPEATATATPLPRRLTTGTYVSSADQSVKAITRNGLGKMTMYNDGNLDAVIGIRNSTRTRVALVYVRQGGNFTMTGVPDGTYDVIFLTGEDYDRANAWFTRLNDGWMRFENPASFKTVSVSGGRQYTIITVRLYPSSGGNARVIRDN
jgi:hypothetical protein